MRENDSRYIRVDEHRTTANNMTLAKEGSVTYYHGKEYCVKADYVEWIVDTTGCGDSYHAGFVCAYLASGEILKAMAVGSKIAAETLTHYGGF